MSSLVQRVRILPTMSNYIPEEIQLYILNFLPVESLSRSRCVCKLWKQTIDSEPFIQHHLSLQKPRLIVECEEPDFLTGYPSELPQIDTLSSPIPGRRIHLVSTLHGILCLFDEFRNEFMLWNPWTRKSITLKNYSNYCWDEYDPEFPMGYCAGFWIDPRSKEYKIVAFNLFDFPEEDDKYDVYSSSTREWKGVPIGDLELYYTIEPTTSTVIGDVGYWTAFYTYYETDDDDDDVEEGEEKQKMNGVVLLVFDFVKEVFLEHIECPGMIYGWDSPVLCNRDGALSLVYMDPEKSCNIFARKEGRWVEVFEVYLLPEVKRILWAEAESGKVVVATENGELIFFDSEKGSYRCLKNGLKVATDFVIANGFVESLLDPN